MTGYRHERRNVRAGIWSELMTRITDKSGRITSQGVQRASSSRRANVLCSIQRGLLVGIIEEAGYLDPPVLPIAVLIRCRQGGFV
jgi:hypothetical protein